MPPLEIGSHCWRSFRRAGFPSPAFIIIIVWPSSSSSQIRGQASKQRTTTTTIIMMFLSTTISLRKAAVAALLLTLLSSLAAHAVRSFLACSPVFCRSIDRSNWNSPCRRFGCEKMLQQGLAAAAAAAAVLVAAPSHCSNDSAACWHLSPPDHGPALAGGSAHRAKPLPAKQRRGNCHFRVIRSFVRSFVRDYIHSLRTSIYYSQHA